MEKLFPSTLFFSASIIPFLHPLSWRFVLRVSDKLRTRTRYWSTWFITCYWSGKCNWAVNLTNDGTFFSSVIILSCFGPRAKASSNRFFSPSFYSHCICADQSKMYGVRATDIFDFMVEKILISSSECVQQNIKKCSINLSFLPLFWVFMFRTICVMLFSVDGGNMRKSSFISAAHQMCF